MPKISKNIKKFRAEKNLTQDALAERLHVTRQAISNWENDKTKPDIEALEALATALEVEVEELIYGERKEVIVSQDKTKAKNRIKIILAIVGSLFVASGLALVFFGFWQKFPVGIQTVFSIIPMLLGQGAAVFTFLKKKDSIPWREGAAIIWTVGVISTIALIDNIYDISWIYTDYLIIDSLLILPVMFILGAVAPLIFYYYMAAHIATVGNLQNVLLSMAFFGLGILFTILLSRNKEEARGKYAQWITVLASLPLLVICTTAGFEANLLADASSVMISVFVAYFLCIFIVTPKNQPISLPYKPIALLGLCVSMITLSMGAIVDTPDVEMEVVPFIASCVLVLLPPLAVGLIKREDLRKDIVKLILSVIPFAMMVLMCILAIVSNPFEYRHPIIYYLSVALTFGFGGLLIYHGVKEIRLFVINLGLLTVFIQIISFFVSEFDSNLTVLGIMLAVFGAVIIGINWKMLSIKKSLKEQLSGGGDNA